MENIPEHLVSTVQLIQKAYPNGIPRAEYFAVLSKLYDHMSDRNLAEAMSSVTGLDCDVVYNDVLGVSGRNLDVHTVCLVANKLDAAGFEVWINDD